MHCANHQRVWTTTHTNGWQAWVAERTDGIYAAGLIGPRQYVRWRVRMWPADRTVGPRLIEQHAFTRGSHRVEALDLLREHTGHVCAPTCPRWVEAEVEAARKR